MKDRVFKALWVDSRGQKWSVMKGVRGFFRNDKTEIWQCNAPVRYQVARPVCPTVNGRPYLFAFASVPSAVDFVLFEYRATVTNGVIVPDTSNRLSARYSRGDKKRFNKGRVEVWEAEADVIPEPKQTDLYEQFLFGNVPYGTIFCKNIKLVGKVDNLL